MFFIALIFLISQAVAVDNDDIPDYILEESIRLHQERQDRLRNQIPVGDESDNDDEAIAMSLKVPVDVIRDASLQGIDPIIAAESYKSYLAEQSRQQALFESMQSTATKTNPQKELSPFEQLKEAIDKGFRATSESA